MIIDITEEEREFLERMCSRAQILARLNFSKHQEAYDMEKIKALLQKLKLEKK